MMWLSIIHQIKSSKPQQCTDAEKVMETFTFTVKLTTDEELNVQLNTTRQMYNKLKRLHCNIPTSMEKYSITFPILNEININNIFLIPRMCTNDNTIKDLQFQILHRYIPTNYLLYKMNKVNSSVCSFCNIHIESIPHLFYECITVKHIWTCVTKVLEKVEMKAINLKCQNVILGLGFENREWMKHKLVNNVILLVKSFIWECKKYETLVTSSLLSQWMSKRLLVDESIQMFNEELGKSLGI